MKILKKKINKLIEQMINAISDNFEPTSKSATREDADDFRCVGKSGQEIPHYNGLLEGERPQHHFLCVVLLFP